MLESRSPDSPGKLFGYTLIAGLILLDLGLLLLIFSEPLTGLSFLWGSLFLVTVPAGAFILFWTSSLSATRYHIDEDTLFIEWGRMRQAVPLADIRYSVLGEDLAEVKGFHGMRWPGCCVGHGYITDKAGKTVNLETIFFATKPVRRQLLLITESVAYGISPVDLGNFADCLGALKGTKYVGRGERRGSKIGFLDWRIWRDRPAQVTLAAAMVLNSALFAYLASIYGQLPAAVPLHFSQSGLVDRMAAPANLFVLPSLGALTWLTNGVIGSIFYQHQERQLLAFLLWAAAIAMQVLTWGALIGFLR